MGLAEFDPEANALYVRIPNDNKKIVKTIPLNEGVYMDVNEDNEPVGIEYVFSQSIPVETLKVLSNLSMNQS